MVGRYLRNPRRLLGTALLAELILLAIVDLICRIKGYPYGQTLLFSGVAVFILGAGVAGVGNPWWRFILGTPPHPLDKFALKVLEAERKAQVKAIVREAKEPTGLLVGLILIIAGVIAIALGALIMLRG